ncbi:hypothetical protein [Leptolyngbya subtilissima]
MPHPPIDHHPLADFRAFLATLPPPTPEQVAEVRRKVMERRKLAATPPQDTTPPAEG